MKTLEKGSKYYGEVKIGTGVEEGKGIWIY